MSYRVNLDIYNGPMDLLLYLIRKEEVEIADIPILRITEQYLAYLDVLQSMDINIAGDFIVMAATLMEIKSRMILPRPEMPADEGEGEDQGDPRLELIRQLLEYKRFKEAAQDLEGLNEDQSRRFSRPSAQVVAGPEEQRWAIDEMMKGVQVWDLLNAFARVMKSINIAPREVIYDDTPIEQIAEQMLTLMTERRTMLFSDLILTIFAGRPQVTRTHLVGAFLAILECTRQRFLSITQDKDFGDLRLFWREEREDQVIDLSEKAAPPHAYITSREAARELDGIERPKGRFKEEISDEGQSTEFDEQLDAIKIPDIEAFKPIYSPEELMGKPEAPGEGQETPAEPTTEPAAPETSAAEQPALPDQPPPEERPTEQS